MCEWTRVIYLCGHTREYYSYECSVYLSGRTGCALTRHDRTAYENCSPCREEEARRKRAAQIRREVEADRAKGCR